MSRRIRRTPATLARPAIFTIAILTYTLVSMATGGPETPWRNTAKPSCTAAILHLIWHSRRLPIHGRSGGGGEWLVGGRGRGGCGGGGNAHHLLDREPLENLIARVIVYLRVEQLAEPSLGLWVELATAL